MRSRPPWWAPYRTRRLALKVRIRRWRFEHSPEYKEMAEGMATVHWDQVDRVVRSRP